jgi:hypothetical protein
MQWLFLIPDEWLILAYIGIAFAVMLRLLRLKAALCIVGLLLLSSMLGPFMEAIVDSLPFWLSLLLLGFFLLSLLRGLCQLVIGREATSEMVGELSADVVRLIFKAFILGPFYILRGVYRLFHERR